MFLWRSVDLLNEAISAQKKKPKIERSSKAFERLTDYESNYIYVALNTFFSNKHCPDCNQGQFIRGPQGGMSTSYCCDYCGAEFNICMWQGKCIGDRIKDRLFEIHRRTYG